MNNSSYTAASTIPAKLFCNKDLFEGITNRKIMPVHIQINPTNKCPLNCSFCSCANRNKNIELDYDFLKCLTIDFMLMGTKAVTITGGGDPLAYPYISHYIKFLNDNEIKIGFVTNGVLFKEIDAEFFKYITWCRVSLSDEYNLLTPKLDRIVKEAPVDWSFSYVINPTTDINKVAKAIEFANKNKFTHVRLVDDILDEISPSKVQEFKNQIPKLVDDHLVIYQGRKTYTRGHKRCLISLLKPNIGPDGLLYPCCGIQYAKDIPSLDLNPKDSMDNPSSSITEVWKSQRYYDGSTCKKCYYSDYNNILNIMWDSSNLNHKEFI